MDDEKLALLALQLVPNIGGTTIKKLISHFGSAQQVLSKSKHQLMRIGGIGRLTSEGVSQSRGLELAHQQLLLAEKKGIELISYTDSNYPKRLSHLYDAPLILFKKGGGECTNHKSIAIVGSRNATKYGVDFTEELVRDLAPHNPLIVSGLAFGIDITAHRAALMNGLGTVGVVASGVNIIYPMLHRKTAIEMQENGAILSEYGINEKANAKKFPARNRIIAGLADAVIIVEAAERSGALITAAFANDNNREVFALPGNIREPYSIGTNNLIKTHQARIITDASDIEYALGWDSQHQHLPDQVSIPEQLTDEEKAVYIIISESSGIDIDQLCWKSTIPLNKLASILLNLEFSGFVNALPGNKYKLSLKRLHV